MICDQLQFPINIIRIKINYLLFPSVSKVTDNPLHLQLNENIDITSNEITAKLILNLAHLIHYPTINYRISRNFISKTYEKSFFSKISPALVYYAKCNNFCIVLKLIDYAFREK